MYRRDASRHRKRKTTPAFGHPSKKEGNLQHSLQKGGEFAAQDFQYDFAMEINSLFSWKNLLAEKPASD